MYQTAEFLLSCNLFVKSVFTILCTLQMTEVQQSIIQH